jgi:hypothetical protein
MSLGVNRACSARTVWDQQNAVHRATTLRLVDQVLDLVQYRETPNMAEVRTLLDQIAAKVPDRRADKEVEALKQLTLSYLDLTAPVALASGNVPGC